MNHTLEEYVKIMAILGSDIELESNLPKINAPKLKNIINEFYKYMYHVSLQIDKYKNLKNDFFLSLIQNEKEMSEFLYFVRYFINFKTFQYENCRLIFEEGEINSENINLLMQCIKILHHYENKNEDYNVSSNVAKQILQRANKLKAEIESKISKKKNEIGFSDIISVVSARHPSLNILNIHELSYYQILEQYKRLMKIDKYLPIINGNASDEYVKITKHYIES